MIIGSSIKMQKNVSMSFVDFEKAFDTVKQEEIIKTLKDIGPDEKGTSTILISNLYWNQKVAVRVDDEKTDWVE